MKQHITKEQAMELSELQSEGLTAWYLDSFGYLYGDTIVYLYLPGEDMLHHGNWDEEREFEKANYIGKVKNYEGGMRPILNIGQMIEFLGDKKMYVDGTYWEHGMTEAGLHLGWEGELCDALWEAVKSKLEVMDGGVNGFTDMNLTT